METSPLQKSRPLLTIAIPTWNRSEELQECIQLIASQIEQVNENVEIFVSDNASSDETEYILCNLETHLNYLRHSRNAMNVGPDQNFLEVLNKSLGKYVWLFSDDDFIVEGAIAEVIHIIKNYEPSYINTNYLYCNDRKIIVDSQPQKRFMIAKDITHADINKVFSERNHWLSFVSCNIYNRSFLDIADYEANVNNVRSWIQVYIAAHILSGNPNGYLSSFYAVLSRVGNGRVNSMPFVMHMPEAFSYIMKKFNVDKNVCKRVLDGIRITFLSFRSFLVHRALGIKTSHNIVPYCYKLAVIFPKSMILIAWKMKRFLGGKGFSFPDI